MIDSTEVIQHAPYKTAQRVKIETPIGSIESDSGNHIVDGITVVVSIMIIYIGKKLVDKFIKN